MFPLCKNKNSYFEKVIEENKKLREEISQYKMREKEIKLKEEKLSKLRLGDYLNEYVCKISEYLCSKKDVTLTLISAVEPTDEIDECFVGLWYGIKVMDKDIEILRIPIFLDGDACFVSELAAKRRRGNLLLTNLLSQYIKYYIDNNKEFTRYVRDVEIKEEIHVSAVLFDPELQGSDVIWL